MLSYKVQNKESAPRRRNPALILDFDATGATAKFQSQTCRVARFCLRKKKGAAEPGGEDVDPSKGRLRTGGLGLGNQQEPADVVGSMDVDA